MSTNVEHHTLKLPAYNTELLDLTYLCTRQNANNMAGTNNDYGKKGILLGKAFVALVILVVVAIWVYGMNQNGLPQ